MSGIKILVLEKDSSFASMLKLNLNKWERVEIVLFRDTEITASYLKKNTVDLIITRPVIRKNGDTLELIANHAAKTPFILIADQANEMIYQKAKELNLLSFLVKPFDIKTLYATLNLYFNNTNNFLLIKKNRETYRLRFEHVLWIKSAGNYSIIQTDRMEYSMKISLTKLKNQFLNEDFIQIHRAFIIRIDKIADINMKTNVVNIANGKLPIGRKYKKDFFNRIEII